MLRANWQSRVLILYCLVLGCAFAFAADRFAVAPHGSEFLGLDLMAVTLPWSLAVTPALAVLTPSAPWFNVLVLLACGIVNVVVIGRLTARRTAPGGEDLGRGGAGGRTTRTRTPPVK